MTGNIIGYRGVSEKSAINVLMEMMRNMQAHIDKLEKDCSEKTPGLKCYKKRMKSISE